MMVTHPMAVNTITLDKLKHMQTLLDKTYKTNMDLNRHFLNVVCRGTTIYEGLSVAPLSIHQGYKHIWLLLGSARNRDSGREMVIQSQECLQLETGISKSILNPHKTNAHAAWLTQTWLTSINKIFSMRRSNIFHKRMDPKHPMGI